MDSWPAPGPASSPAPAPPGPPPGPPGAYPPNGSPPPPRAPGRPARGSGPPGQDGGPRGGGSRSPAKGKGKGTTKGKSKTSGKAKGKGQRTATSPRSPAGGRRPEANRSGRGAGSSPRRPDSRKARARRREPARWARLAPVYDIDGPRIRLGVLWFLVALPAVVGGQYTTALLYGGAAAWGARQTAKAWKAAPWQADLAAALAAVPVLAATAGHVPLFGALALVGVVGVIAGCNAPAAGLRGGPGRGAAAGALVAATVPISLAAGSMVLVRGVSPDVAVVLLGLVSLYEMGDFVVGSGGSTTIEGPLAGMAALVVVSFPMALLLVEPFDVMGMLLVGIAAVSCPVGQWIASAVLPDPGAKAPALRRIDTLILLGPLWAAAAGALT